MQLQLNCSYCSKLKKKRKRKKQSVSSKYCYRYSLHSINTPSVQYQNTVRHWRLFIYKICIYCEICIQGKSRVQCNYPNSTINKLWKLKVHDRVKMFLWSHGGQDQTCCLQRRSWDRELGLLTNLVAYVMLVWRTILICSYIIMWQKSYMDWRPLGNQK